jgi:hypothetical protein
LKQGSDIEGIEIRSLNASDIKDRARGVQARPMEFEAAEANSDRPERSSATCWPIRTCGDAMTRP